MRSVLLQVSDWKGHEQRSSANNNTLCGANKEGMDAQ